LKDVDTIILTETFLTEPLDLQGFYAIHSYATPTAGRPAGGITYFLKKQWVKYKDHPRKKT
jgi:hypothetical protein